MTLAEKIVICLDAYRDRYYDLDDKPELDILVLTARERYQALEREHDFTTSGRLARTEMVESLLKRDQADVQ